MTTRMSPRQERTLSTDLSDEQILQTAAAALADLGAQAIRIDHDRGSVEATTGMTGRSWGEHVTVRIEDRDDHLASVAVHCVPRLRATLADWGEASRICAAITAAFDPADASTPTSDHGDEPIGPLFVAGDNSGRADVPPPVPTPPQPPVWELPGGMVPSGRRRPGWYIAAGVVAVLCLVGAAAILQAGGEGFERRVEVMQRVPIPGQRVLYARGSTEFTVFYEVRGEAQEGVVAPPLTIEVVGQDGQPVLLDRPWLDQTYALPGHSGQAVATFSADAGEYVLTVDGNAPPGAMLAIGVSPFGSLLWAGLLVAVAVAVIVVAVIVSLLHPRAAVRNASASRE